MPGGCACDFASRIHRYVSAAAPGRINRHVKVPSGETNCRASVRRPRKSLVAL